MPAVEPQAQEQSRTPVPTDHRLGAGEPTGREGRSSGIGGLLRKLALVLVLLAAAGFTWWKIQSNKADAAQTQNKTAQAANRPIPVSTVAVVAKTMPIYLTALGTVTAYNTVTIKSRVDGQLLSVNVREGQQVKQGQLVAVIDPRPYQAVQAQAEGQLAKDQASADYTKAEAGRYTALYQAGVVSKDQQQVQQSSAGQSAGVLEADRAQIQAAKVNVAYTRITSPINGVVGLRQVDAGNIVHASDANGMIVVTQLQPIAVIFTMPEDQLPVVEKTMRAGKKLVVEAYDRSDSTLLSTGTLLTLDNQIDTTTGTVKAKAVFTNKDGALFPNQFVNVRLVLEQRPDSLVMPVTALQTGATGTYVYLLKPGVPPRQSGEDGPGGTGKDSGAAHKPGGSESARTTSPGTAAGSQPGARSPAGGDASADAGPRKPPFYVDVQNVVVDLTEGSQLILKSGLKAGDQVVVDGQEKLKKFSKVDPSAARPAGGRGPGRSGSGAPQSGAPQSGAAQSGAPQSGAAQSGPSKSDAAASGAGAGATGQPGGIESSTGGLGKTEGTGGGNAASDAAASGDEKKPRRGDGADPAARTHRKPQP